MRPTMSSSEHEIPSVEAATAFRLPGRGDAVGVTDDPACENRSPALEGRPRRPGREP